MAGGGLSKAAEPQASATGLLALDRQTRDELLTGAARTALSAWGLRGAQVRILEQKTTITFRVDTANGSESQRFLLRVCQLGAYEKREVASEAIWLLALRQSGLLVPEPVPTLEGPLVIPAFLPEWGGTRWCLLYRWVPGQMIESELTPGIIEQLGELAGRIHRCAEQFVPPPEFSRPRWDCDRLFGRDTVIPSGKGEPLITARTREILDAAAREVRREMEALGEAPEVFGIIHKDLEPDNTVIDEGRLHAIDFADCGWGWYLYDIAASLLPLREKKGYAEMRAAFLRGYRSVRPLSAEHEELLETFLIARSLFTIRFMVLTSLEQRPELQSYANVVIPMMIGEIRRYLERRTGAAPLPEESAKPARTTIVQFLGRLRGLGIKLWAEGDKLRFTAPQGALTPELRAELGERKIEVLAFLRQGKATDQAPGPTRRGAPEFAPVPLSFAQQRLWFLDQLHPGSAEYNIARAVRLTGDLRVEVLERSLNEVIRRHAVLRTTFAMIDGEARQIVSPRLALRLPVVDLAGLSEEERLAEAQRIIDSEGQRPFDLVRGPLARICLLRLAACDHLAASTMHHIISDGWSTGLLFREMGLLYESLLAGRPAPLPELPIQYTDFSWWQREILEGEVLANQLAWWKEQFAGAPETLDLPTDHPRSAVRDSRGGKVNVAIARELTERLREQGQAAGATLFMVLFAAWNALLARVSGQDDMVLGIPIANRNRTEVEPLIGFFVNTLALRTRLNGDPVWRELVGRVRQTTVGAYAHQDLPFERLVAELRPDRALAGNPLFQVMFALQNAQREEALSLPGLTMSASPLGMSGGPAKFDLTLSLQDGEGGVKGSLEYRAELFDAPTMARLMEHWQALLEGVATDPEVRLSALPLLTEPERHQISLAWNDTSGPDPARCLHELFAERASARPGAVAVVSDDGELTYGELRAQAGRLAAHLRRLGVRPDQAVGLCLERSAGAVVGLLGILEAGGAFVPLDPGYPAERLAHMAGDAGLRLLVTDRRMRDRLPSLPGMERVVLLEEIEGEEPGPEPATVLPDHLAYVMFTSGSTGRPKGVAVTHRAVVRLVLETNFARLGPDEVFLQYAPLSFDASTLEIWGCLLNGGRLVVPPEGRASLEDLGRVIAEGQVTTLWLTAGLFHRMAEDHPEGLLGVRQLLAGGDVLSPGHVRRALERSPGMTLINGYGPTENTTFTCCHWMTSPDEVESPVPIGRPITGTRAVLLDRWSALAPIGVVGELHAAGHGLARGYAGRPDLTAERFVPHPFPAVPGERLYRTGDLARWRPDGTIEFLGRRDHQVKVRGFRIELGEIESALIAVPGVRDAVVLVSEPAPGDKRLVAYVIPEAPAPDSTTLREALRDVLPDYMVPAAFVIVDTFPLGATGKVDRRALALLGPAPETESTDAVGQAPHDPVEEILAGIFAEVLRTGRVGREDDFFALGGHSLLATQVVSRVRAAFRLELPLQLLFEAPTVAGLAAAVREELRRGQGPEAPPVVPVPRDRDLPLSFAQQRLWFLDRFEPGSAAYNIPGAVRLTGRLAPVLLERAAREVVRRHEALRTTFAERAGTPVQVIAAEPLLRLPVVDLSALSAASREAETRRLAGREALRPFDLTTGPLLRTTLLRLDEREHVALVTFHHIVADGWSMGLFMAELAALYAALSRGEASPLPSLPVQYADFAVWQRSWLQGEVLEAELGYWRQQLASLPRSLELPTDRSRPALQTFRGRSIPLSVPAELAERVAGLARREGATLFMALLAAFEVFLGRLARTEDLAVGSPIAGRNRRETEGLIGFFVNTLVLRGDLSGEPTGRELLGRVRRTSLEAYVHQDIPFERLVEELRPERDLSFHPLFQVLFALQNAPQGELALPELSLAALEAPGETAKFDLTLSLQESASGLRGSLEHNRDLFDEATVERWVSSFQTLLASMADRPELPIADWGWLSESESHQILVDWNATGTTGVPDTCLHRLFEEQARRTPLAVAVVCRDIALTYADLDDRATMLAHRLRFLGVGPEVRVGVCLERGLDLVVALLGVLKAGGAYVPIDPAYPPERLAFMLEDAAGRVLLTQESLRFQLPETDATVLCLDRPAEDSLSVSPLPAPDPSCLAYVIYTSGSTGRPKGVAIEHRSAVAMVRWAREIFSPEEMDGVLASTSVCFDLSVFEIFVPLSWGGRVIVAENALELPALAATGEEVRLLNTVPSAMAELLRLDAVPPSVRTINLAGEALQETLADSIHRRAPVRLFNLYGPSEDTTYSTFALVPAGGGEPTIGRPLRGTQAYVLDPRHKPVPIGVPGELWLGGEGLARGYLGRPARTAEGFVPDPFSAQPGSRLYRTGDLVRLLPSGDLQYLGRIDHQVKVRGFRIELGEIEAVLARQPDVREAAVLVREDRPGDRRLVAYVAPVVGAAALRDALREELPVYMVPSDFAFLEFLPRTPNGKLDRKALARVVPDRTATSGRVATAADAVEELLAGIWAEVLGRDAVGRTESFFEIGGHSLLATQVMSRIRDVFRVELPLQRLFAAPTLVDLASLVRVAIAEDGRAVAPPIVPVPRDRDLPLSFAQQRLWFLDQLQPGSPAYNLPAIVRLRGSLKVPVLAAVLREIVRRHEALRTTFAAADGEPVQKVTSEASLPLPVVDLEELPEKIGAEEARRLAVAETRRPFDLETGPLVRAALVRLCSDEYVALLTFHHIISDGWSISVFLREVKALYTAFSEGDPSPLPELPVQSADFAVWQHGWLTGEVLESEVSFWRRHLGDAPRGLELPTDRPRPAQQTFAGREMSIALDSNLAAELARLARREGITLFMALLAPFQVLLSRLAYSETVAVGTPIAGRNHRETEDLIGCFVNTLVLATDLGGRPSVHELLQRVRQVALDAYAHQDVPFERLVEELQPQRDLSANPLFQVLFTLHNTPRSALELPGLSLAPLDAESGTAKFDLSLALREEEKGLRGSLEYNTDLFDDATVERWMRSLRVLLREVVEEGDRPLAEVPWLDAAERRQVLMDWNGTGTTGPADLCLHELIEVQAARTPGAVALVAGQTVLTYSALDAQAERLAGALRSLGVGPEERVGVCLERGADLIIALLAVLKAGGAYVPLDPAYPPERLAFMVGDAEGKVLLTQESLLSRLPSEGTRTICLDRGLPDLPPQPGPRGATGPEHLAYVIYTSGSTGHPKGVAIEHHSAVALARWARQLFSDEELAGVLAATSVCFDLSVFEIFVPLAWGGSVILVENALALAGMDALPAGIEVRLVNTVPSAMTELVRLGALPPTVRTVNLAGEALPGALVERIYRTGTVDAVYNLYGPSEDTTYSTFARAERGSTEPPIGRPLTGTRAYVMDDRFEPVPVGVPGELWLAGEGLARGYLGRPEKTAESFLPDPFSCDPGARLYRTGDLVRLLPGGSLGYLGRIDHQVKVRGFRIELGEIETELLHHTAVRETVAVARGSSADKRIVAYLAVEGELLDTGELRDRLRRRLPEHMVPSAFVVLPALPRTPNGKVDRRALPEPELARGREHVPPRDELELQLVRIWEDLLGTSQVGVRDDFFELGGHSLLAVRLMGRIRSRFGRVIPLTALFQHTTVESLAALLRRRAGTTRRTPLVPIQPEGEGAPLFLVHPIGGNVLCYADLARRLGPGRPLYGLQTPEPEGRPAANLEEMAAAYIEAARKVHGDCPWLLGGWSMGGAVAFEMARQLVAVGEEVGLLAVIDGVAPGTEGAPRAGEDDPLLFARDLAGLLGIELAPDGLAALDLRRGGIDALLIHLAATGEAAGLDGDDLRSLFALFQTNLAVFGRSTARPYPGSMVLLRTAETATTLGDSALGWSGLATGGIEIVGLPGSHYTLLRTPDVEVLAHRLSGLLERSPKQ